MKLAGERRALAAVVFIFYAIAYAVLALSALQPSLGPSFYALAGVYALAFFALVAGYFWARWYAMGVGIYGLLVGAIGMWQIGAEPLILFIAGTHAAAVVMLMGEAMSAGFDGKTAWREKFHMDDNAVRRLGKSVIRAGVSLPMVLLYALAPKQPAEAVAGLVAFALVGFGMRALVQMKTWGVLALGASGVVMTSLGLAHVAEHSWALFPLASGGLLIAAAAPFIAPMLRHVRA
ncbi:MAG TPA: hypothetical protein VGC41_13925 [Kofleriaceae bacterium]